MTELQRDAPFFDKVLVIRLQSGLQEARQIPLTVRIIPGIRPSSIHGQNEKLFHVEVCSARCYIVTWFRLAMTSEGN